MKNKKRITQLKQSRADEQKLKEQLAFYKAQFDVGLKSPNNIRELDQ